MMNQSQRGFKETIKDDAFLLVQSLAAKLIVVQKPYFLLAAA